MFDRLKINVDECIDAYLSLLDRVFQKKRHQVTTKSNIQDRFDSKKLERTMKEIVIRQEL